MRRNKVLTTLAAVSMSALMAVTTVAPAVPALAADENSVGQTHITVSIDKPATVKATDVKYKSGDRPDITVDGKAVDPVFLKDGESFEKYNYSGKDVAVEGWDANASLGEHQLKVYALKKKADAATIYTGSVRTIPYTVAQNTVDFGTLGLRLEVAHAYYTDELNRYKPEMIDNSTGKAYDFTELPSDLQVVITATDEAGHTVATTTFDDEHPEGVHTDGKTGDNAPSYVGTYDVTAKLEYKDGFNKDNSGYLIGDDAEDSAELQVLEITKDFNANINDGAKFGELPSATVHDQATDEGTQTSPRRVYFKITKVVPDETEEDPHDVHYARYDNNTGKIVLVDPDSVFAKEIFGGTTRNTDKQNDNGAENSSYSAHDLSAEYQYLDPGEYKYEVRALANGKVAQSDIYQGTFNVGKAALDTTEIYPQKNELRDGWKSAYSVKYAGDKLVLNFRALAGITKRYESPVAPLVREAGQDVTGTLNSVNLENNKNWKVTITDENGDELTDIDSIQNVGTYHIVVSATADNKYYSGAAAEATLTVSKLNQIVNIYNQNDEDFNADYNGHKYTDIEANAQTDVTVTITDADGNDIPVEQDEGGLWNTVDTLHAGTYTIKASTPGNINYNAAEKTQELVINQVDFKDHGFVDNDNDPRTKHPSYDGAVQLPNYTVHSDLDGDLEEGTGAHQYTVSAEDGYDNKSVFTNKKQEQYNKITLNKAGDYYFETPGNYVIGKNENTDPEVTSSPVDGEVDTKYYIDPLALAPFADAQQVRFSDATYDGTEKNPADYVTVRAVDGKVIPASDYSVEPTGDTTKPGTYQVTVKGDTLDGGKSESKYANVTGYSIQNFTINTDAVKTAENNQKAAQDLVKTLEESNKTSKDALDQAQKALEESKKQTEEAKKQAEAQQKAAEEAQKQTEAQQKAAEEAKNQSKAQQQIADNTQKPAEVKTQNVYRVYNPNSGEHLYTTSKGEVNSLAKIGWRDEGLGWKGLTAETGKPVYRLYNKNGGEHFYTLSLGEKNNLVKHGWRDEGIAFYAADQKNGVAVYRQYNPNKFANNHNFTTNDKERAHLVNIGWKDEGVAWYAAK